MRKKVKGKRVVASAFIADGSSLPPMNEGATKRLLDA